MKVLFAGGILEDAPCAQSIPQKEKEKSMDTQETPTQTPTGTPQAPRTEEFKITGDDIMAKIKELVREGNVRRIIIKNDQGHPIVEFPLTAGVIGAAILPVYAALGAVLALAANY